MDVIERVSRAEALPADEESTTRATCRKNPAQIPVELFGVSTLAIMPPHRSGLT
jgi:hypothetical protein